MHRKQKNILSWLPLLLISYGAQAQTTSPTPAQYYQEAYRHILNTPELKQWKRPCIAVFDSIVALDQLGFSEALKKEWGYIGYKKEHVLRDSLYALDRAKFHKPYYLPETADLTTASGAEKNCLVIIFSSLSNDMLLAEVSDNQGGGTGLKHIVSKFDQSIVYLLQFGPDGKVLKYYTHDVSYN